MEDSLLVKISLLISIIGLISIFLIINFSITKLTLIPNIDDSSKSYIRTYGIVESIKVHDKITLVTISSKNLIDILIFDNISLNVGDSIFVEGQLKEFKGKNEIIANLVSLSDNN